VSSEADSLEARLTEGFARVHELERTVLRLQREGDELLARGGDPSEVTAVAAERRAAEMELAALRRRLEQTRETG
jgi:hypothetical protein